VSKNPIKRFRNYFASNASECVCVSTQMELILFHSCDLYQKCHIRIFALIFMSRCANIHRCHSYKKQYDLGMSFGIFESGFSYRITS
jgi:hypothetical protein